jgi:hypothetical protein
MQNIYRIYLPYNTIKFNNRFSTERSQMSYIHNQSRPEGGVGGGEG